MELTAALRLLWTRKPIVAVGFVLAFVVAVLMVYQVKPGLPPQIHSKQSSMGVGSAIVLIDTPHSQIADLVPQNFDPGELNNQTSLLGSLMATYPVAEEIAAQAHIPGDQFLVTPPPSSLGAPIRPTPLGQAGAKGAASVPASYKLSVSLDANLPMLAISTVAPDPQSALRLANTAISVLREHLNAIADAQGVPESRRLVVNVIDPARAVLVVSGARKLYGMVAAIVVLGLFCLGVVVITRSRERRKAALAEGFTAEDVGEAGVAAVPGAAQVENDDEPEIVHRNGHRDPRLDPEDQPIGPGYGRAGSDLPGFALGSSRQWHS